jgi:hypothetical protein
MIAFNNEINYDIYNSQMQRYLKYGLEIQPDLNLLFNGPTYPLDSLNDFENSDLMCVYGFENVTLQKFYIGKAMEPGRFRKHKCSLINGTHYNKSMQANYNQGHEFIFRIIHKVDPLYRYSLRELEYRYQLMATINNIPMYSLARANLFKPIVDNSTINQFFKHIKVRNDNNKYMNSPCWEKPNKRTNKYGELRFRSIHMWNKSYKLVEHNLHRFSYLWYYKIFSPFIIVRHMCDNPACSNPFHLNIGDERDNGNDKCDIGSFRKKTITKEIALQILEMRKIYTIRKITEKLNIDATTVANVCNGRLKKFKKLRKEWMKNG